jgi:glycosyltransferase involved in cell wall biosynthesis
MERHEERIAVIIPALNEEETVGDVISKCHEALQGRIYDILLVDGHSSDNTVNIAKREGARVIFQKGAGYGDALVCGFGYALRVLRPDIVVMIDADGTYQPQNINNLLEPILNDEADLVIGNRFAGLEKGAMSLTNKIGNKFFSGLSEYLFKIPSLDTQSGFRAFRARILGSLIFKNFGMPLASEMIIEAKKTNYRITQVPITYQLRRGKSKLRPLRDGSLILGALIRLYRDWSPLFFFGAFGGFLLVVGVVLTLYLFIMYSVTGVAPNVIFAVTAAVMFVSGLIIMVMGFLADMIKDVRERLRVFEMQLSEILLNNQDSKPKRADEKNKE